MKTLKKNSITLQSHRRLMVTINKSKLIPIIQCRDKIEYLVCKLWDIINKMGYVSFAYQKTHRDNNRGGRYEK